MLYSYYLCKVCLREEVLASTTEGHFWGRAVQDRWETEWVEREGVSAPDGEPRGPGLAIRSGRGWRHICRLRGERRERVAVVSAGDHTFPGLVQAQGGLVLPCSAVVPMATRRGLANDMWVEACVWLSGGGPCSFCIRDWQGPKGWQPPLGPRARVADPGPQPMCNGHLPLMEEADYAHGSMQGADMMQTDTLGKGTCLSAPRRWKRMSLRKG